MQICKCIEEVKNRDAVMGMWRKQLLTTVWCIRWECDTEPLEWEQGEKAAYFHEASVFDKSFVFP